MNQKANNSDHFYFIQKCITKCARKVKSSFHVSSVVLTNISRRNINIYNYELKQVKFFKNKLLIEKFQPTNLLKTFLSTAFFVHTDNRTHSSTICLKCINIYLALISDSNRISIFMIFRILSVL